MGTGVNEELICFCFLSKVSCKEEFPGFGGRGVDL